MNFTFEPTTRVIQAFKAFRDYSNLPQTMRNQIDQQKLFDEYQNALSEYFDDLQWNKQEEIFDHMSQLY